MTDAPRTQSVVVDANAKVTVSKTPIYVAVAAMIAFAVFAIVWFAVDDDDDYEPGPLAGAIEMVSSEFGIDAHFSDHELRCIDHANRGGNEVLSVLGKVTDCFTEKRRGELVRATVESPAVRCVGGVVVQTLLSAGVVDKVVKGGQDAVVPLLLELLPKLSECGVNTSKLVPLFMQLMSGDS